MDPCAHIEELEEDIDDLRKALFRTAKFIEHHHLQSDRLLHALEDAASGGTPQQLAVAAYAIVRTAETPTYTCHGPLTLNTYCSRCGSYRTEEE